jgi:hypothetical protein
VTECPRVICSQIQNIKPKFSNVGRVCPTLQLRNYETQRKAEYEVFTAKYRRGRLWRSKSGLKNQQRFFTAAKANPLEKVKILEIVQLQQIKSSTQKTTRIKSHGLSRRAVAESKIHAENNLKVQLKWGSNIFQAHSISEDERKDVKDTAACSVCSLFN